MDNKSPLSFESLDDLILLNIFSHLPIISLKKSMQICSRWCRLARETLANRQRKVQTSLFCVEDESKFTGRNCYINKQEFINNAKQQYSRLRVEPHMILYLLTSNLANECIVEEEIYEKQIKLDENELSNARKKIKIPKEKLSKLSFHLNNILLDDKVPKLYVHSYGIIGTCIDNLKSQEIEKDCHNPAICSLVIPKNKHYRFHFKSHFPWDKNEKLENLISENQILEYFGVDSETEELKSIFMFCSKTSHNCVVSFMKNLNKIRTEKGANSSNNFTFSGAVVDSSFINNQPKSSRILFLVLIGNKQESGDSVRVCQIVIPDVDKSDFEKVFLEKLEKAKNTGILTESNQRDLIAFQITCCAKGIQYHNDNNYEASLFRKLFKSDIRVVGLFGYAEFGMDYLPDFNQTTNVLDNHSNSSDFNLRMLSYSSVFTIISLKSN